MLSLARNGFSAAVVQAALHGPNVRFDFRYELLNSLNQFKAELSTVLGGSVRHSAFATIHRTAKIRIRDDNTIDFLSDRIKPFARLWVPPGRILRGYAHLLPWQIRETVMRTAPEEGGWADFPLGVLLLSTPSKVIDQVGDVIRDVEAYDQCQVLLDDKVEDRYTVPASTNYIAAVATLLSSAGITDSNLTATTRTLPADRDWPPGTPKLRIINALLSSINYRAIFFDPDGFAVAIPYVSPAVAPVQYTYRDDETSVMFMEAEVSLDLFSVPNRWVRWVEEPDRAEIRAVYTNTNPSSPTSTLNRGRTIVDVQTVDAADQAALDGLAERAAFHASQVYEQVTIETGLMPFHTHFNVLQLRHQAAGVNAKYLETGWTLNLKSDTKMKHTVRRVVSV